MKNKTKNIVNTVVFAGIIAFFTVLCVIRYFNPEKTSVAERRQLAQFPKITWKGILNKTVIDDFEDYSVDQFPFRESFRSAKARFQLNVLMLKENNCLAVAPGGYIAKIQQSFTPDLVDYSLSRLQFVYDKFLKDNGGNKYVSVIPDKNYFLAQNYGYPSPDYDGLVSDVKAALREMEYIDIFPELELNDYYRTDTHWSQDKLEDVVSKLAASMGFSERLKGNYTQNELYPFYGVYHGQSSLNPKPDTIVYLTNEIIDACTVYDYETDKTYSIYNFDKFNGTDGYDFFLSGTKALLRIDNPNAATDKELIIFRDSFGSSLTPLLAEAYKSIYVIDIRYISPMILDNYIDFANKDVLFLYSALILNSKTFK